MRSSWDLVRIVILLLFGLAIGETLWIVRVYLKIIRSTRRLLPIHVGTISLGVLGLEAEAAWQSVSRFGEPFTPYIAVNLFMFGLVYVALLLMRIHITRKADAHERITSLLDDKDMTP